MKIRSGRYNPKRKLRDMCSYDWCHNLARTVKYGGNPEHKRNPGNFGLTPPAAAKPHKTLCDDCGIFDRAVAKRLLASGARKGLVSVQMKGEWPQNIWAVTDDGCPLEAQLENQETGTYHGYPLPESDPMRATVLARWCESAHERGK